MLLSTQCLNSNPSLQPTSLQTRHTTTAVQAIAELKRFTSGVAAGEVLIPIAVQPPKPPPPTIKERLQQGQTVPKRKKRLPWDQDMAEGATPQKSSTQQGVLPEPKLPQGRQVSYSEREHMLAQAAEAARALSNTSASTRRTLPLASAAAAAGQQAGARQTKKAQWADFPNRPPLAVDLETAKDNVLQGMGRMGELRAEYELIAM